MSKKLKEEYNPVLDKMLLKVMAELKKKMFPRKHIKLLWNDVKICIAELEKDVAGKYETIKDKKHKHKFKHKIFIDREVFDEFQRGYLPDVIGEGKYKRCTRKRLKDVIAHELIHAYVYEKYEFCGYNYGFHSDGSPIFLAILVFLGIPSGHKSMKSFTHSKVYEKVKQYDSFELLEIYLIHLTCRYEDKFKELEDICCNDNRFYSNSFVFSAGDTTGVKGIWTATAIDDKNIVKANIFELGANAEIEELRDLVISKIDRNVFDKKDIANLKDNIAAKKLKLKLQSRDI